MKFTGSQTLRAGRLAAVLAGALLLTPVAFAQDATPMAGAEGDAMVRAMDPEALPEGWQVPATATHITNYGVHEWYQNLTKGEAARAEDYGITFNQVDANLDLQASLAAVQEVAPQVDVINFTPVNEEASGPTIVQIAEDTGKPIICESSPTDGCTTLVSIDDYAAGFKVGVWAGEYARDNFGGNAVVLDVGLPALTTTVNRSNGFVDGLKSVLPDARVAASVDGKGLKDEAVKVANDALTANPDVNIIFGINDDSALGGLHAFESLGGDTSQLLVVGFGGAQWRRAAGPHRRADRGGDRRQSRRLLHPGGRHLHAKLRRDQRDLGRRREVGFPHPYPLSHCDGRGDGCDC